MANKFRWNGSTAAAGDDAPDAQKINFAPDLPAPPHRIYELMNRAREVSMWIRWARNPQVLARWRQRYRLSKAGSSAVVYASDDLDEIEACIREFESEA